MLYKNKESRGIIKRFRSTAIRFAVLFIRERKSKEEI